MPVAGNYKLAMPDGRTIHDISKKHQLNPKNTGVNKIDFITRYNKVTGTVGRTSLMRIYRYGTDKAVLVELKGIGMITIPENCRVMTSTEEFVCAADGTLQAANKLALFEKGELVYHPILSIHETYTLPVCYKLITASKSPYLLDNGLIIASDES